MAPDRNPVVEQSSLLPELFGTLYKGLNEQQTQAMKLLHGHRNVFVTGGAGTGKSYLIQNYLKGTDRKCIPVLASTGAAAVLVGGRTFHSFFGLGILEGGPEVTIDRALRDKRVVSRLRNANAIVIDEISMIPGEILSVAETIASLSRDSTKPWGGIKIIAVGDFAQLPPINRYSNRKDWAFLNPAWHKTQFLNVHLTQMMRSGEDINFCEALSDIRHGIVSERVSNLLDDCSEMFDGEEFTGSVLFAKKVDVERVNNDKLSSLGGESMVFPTTYVGSDRFKQMLAKSAPVVEHLILKKNAFVMLRTNDPKGRWVNGSLGHIKRMDDSELQITLLNGRDVEISPASFTMLDADGKEVASARNFPVSLAWAVTIHKSQGATLDNAMVTLRNLWEPGQAYVALSRVRSSRGLKVSSWDARSIMADPKVIEFHSELENALCP
ncbi:AAA family ATPase [bacterium]|nr:AAA family ATPase [bacterium]